MRDSHRRAKISINAIMAVLLPIMWSDAVITPVASLTYSRLRQNGYSESSDGGMALTVDSQDNDSLVPGLGLKGLLPIATDTRGVTNRLRST